MESSVARETGFNFILIGHCAAITIIRLQNSFHLAKLKSYSLSSNPPSSHTPAFRIFDQDSDVFYILKIWLLTLWRKFC